VWNTNLIISMATGVASTVVYSVSGSSFDAAKLTATLWLASVVIQLKDANWDFGTVRFAEDLDCNTSPLHVRLHLAHSVTSISRDAQLKDAPLEKVVAATAAYLAFA
jgi:hypothetical protein